MKGELDEKHKQKKQLILSEGQIINTESMKFINDDLSIHIQFKQEILDKQEVTQVLICTDDELNTAAPPTSQMGLNLNILVSTSDGFVNLYKITNSVLK